MRTRDRTDGFASDTVWLIAKVPREVLNSRICRHPYITRTLVTNSSGYKKRYQVDSEGIYMSGSSQIEALSAVYGYFMMSPRDRSTHLIQYRLVLLQGLSSGLASKLRLAA